MVIATSGMDTRPDCMIGGGSLFRPGSFGGKDICTRFIYHCDHYHIDHRDSIDFTFFSKVISSMDRTIC